MFVIRKRIAELIRWHKYIGVAISPIVVMVVITGILINHSAGLGWADNPVYSSTIASLYGIPVDHQSNGFVTQKFWFVQRAEQVLMSSEPLFHCDSTLLGAVQLKSEVAVLCGNTLALFTWRGELIETLQNLPAQSSSLGKRQNNLLLSADEEIFVLDQMAGKWLPDASEIPIEWSSKVALDEQLVADLRTPIPGITQERVLLDLHSGRLFGPLGVWLVDLAAILLLFLAFSGVLTWWKRRSGARRKL